MLLKGIDVASIFAPESVALPTVARASVQRPYSS